MPDETIVAISRQELDEFLRDIVAQSSRWLTIEGSASYASLSPESIRRLISAGKLTPRRPVRGRILIDRLELDAYIAGSTGAIRNGRGAR